MRNFRVPALVAVIITAIGIGTWLAQSSLQRVPAAAQASVAKKISASGSKDWLIPTQEYMRQFPAQKESSQIAVAPEAVPAVVKDGPMSKQLASVLAPILAGYVGPELTASDEKTTPNPMGSVKWRAKTGDGGIVASMQQLTEPLPIGMIGGNDNAPVGHLNGGSEYIIVDHAPFFRQLIIVKPDGMFFQIAAVAEFPRLALGISGSQFLKIAKAIDASR